MLVSVGVPAAWSSTLMAFLRCFSPLLLLLPRLYVQVLLVHHVLPCAAKRGLLLSRPERAAAVDDL
jgi:hypothetical protein